MIGGSVHVVTASAYDVAAALRERLPGIGRKKLHTLLYYCQGHHLATFQRPLFGERLSARDYGPVVESLRQNGSESPHPEQPLDEGELNTVGYVVSRYGTLTGDQLARLARTEHPWRAGNERRLVGDSDHIELGWIQAYFADVDTGDDDSETGANPGVVRRWLASTAPPEQLPPGKPDSRDALLSRLFGG
jgi:uncharacterized phage-associated protein